MSEASCMLVYTVVLEINVFEKFTRVTKQPIIDSVLYYMHLHLNSLKTFAIAFFVISIKGIHT